MKSYKINHLTSGLLKIFLSFVPHVPQTIPRYKWPPFWASVLRSISGQGDEVGRGTCRWNTTYQELTRDNIEWCLHNQKIQPRKKMAKTYIYIYVCFLLVFNWYGFLERGNREIYVHMSYIYLKLHNKHLKRKTLSSSNMTDHFSPNERQVGVRYKSKMMLKITPQVGCSATSLPPTSTTRISSSVMLSRTNMSWWWDFSTLEGPSKCLESMSILWILVGRMRTKNRLRLDLKGYEFHICFKFHCPGLEVCSFSCSQHFVREHHYSFLHIELAHGL